MEHLHDDHTPLSHYLSDKDSVRVVEFGHNEMGEETAVLQGERFEKQIHTQMPDGTPAADRLYPILPPGAEQYPDFLKRCTACGKCIAACPEHILKPATHEFEVYEIRDALGKPIASFEMGYCRPNCRRCVDACSDGALHLADLIQKRTQKIGWAQFNSRTCIAMTDGVNCDACQRHCPQQAISLVEKEGHKVPRVHPSLCNGCGACEFYCPARPKAIYVEGI